MHARHYGEGMDALLAAAAAEGVRLACPGFQGAKMVQVRAAALLACGAPALHEPKGSCRQLEAPRCCKRGLLWAASPLPGISSWQKIVTAQLPTSCPGPKGSLTMFQAPASPLWYETQP